MTEHKILANDQAKRTNSNYGDFHNRNYTILDGYTVIKTALKPIVDAYKAQLDRYELTMVAISGSAYTKAVDEADDYRDMVHSGFIHCLKSCQKCGDEVKMAAADRLMFACKQFGFTKLREAPHNEQSELMQGQVNLLRSDEYKADLEALPEVASYLTIVEDAMAKFVEVADSKVGEEASRVKFTSRDVRNEMTPIYRRICNAVESFADAGIDPEYAAYINELNALIKVTD